MIKLLEQECIRKGANLCQSQNVKLKFKHDTTILNIAQIEIKNEKVSFIGRPNVFSHIIDTAQKVNNLPLIF